MACIDNFCKTFATTRVDWRAAPFCLYAVISGDGISKEADFEGVFGEIKEKKGQNDE